MRHLVGQQGFAILSLTWSFHCYNLHEGAVSPWTSPAAAVTHRSQRAARGVSCPMRAIGQQPARRMPPSYAFTCILLAQWAGLGKGGATACHLARRCWAKQTRTCSSVRTAAPANGVHWALRAGCGAGTRAQLDRCVRAARPLHNARRFPWCVLARWRRTVVPARVLCLG